MSRLSSQKHPAYHLRPNKAIDRFIFTEILRTLETICPLIDHTYIGFGGPFLEDFRIISKMFPKLNLVSIEADEETYKRQIFHCCSSRLKIKQNTFDQYLATEFPSDCPVIVWADYTGMNRKCLLEASDLARKATPWSILRITVFGESPVYRELKLGIRRPIRVPGKLSNKFSRFSEKYRREMTVDGIAFDQAWFTWDGFTETNFPETLSKMIISVLKGSCSRPKTFSPLHVCKYSDGVIMLSLTGVICELDEVDRIRDHFSKFCAVSEICNGSVGEIDVPFLTTKERLHLDPFLPTSSADGKKCLNKLGYLIEGDDSEKSSGRKMAQYEKHFRLYPYFGKLLP